MAFYRLKKIEAMQVPARRTLWETRLDHDMQKVAEFCGGSIIYIDEETPIQLNFDTTPGNTTANVGDYIVKTGKNSFIVMPQSEFENLYESE